jgi:hypothetical protein
VKQHVTLVAALQIGQGALILLGALVVTAVLLLSGWLFLPVNGDGPAVFALLTGIGLAIGLFLLLLALPSIIGGWGLLKGKSWARYLVLIVAAFSLLNVPVGTVIATYTFWVLLQDETEKLLAPAAGH